MKRWFGIKVDEVIQSVILWKWESEPCIHDFPLPVLYWYEPSMEIVEVEIKEKENEND